MQPPDCRHGRRGEGIDIRRNRGNWAEHPDKSSRVRGDQRIAPFGASIRSGFHDLATIGMASLYRMGAAGRIVDVAVGQNSSSLKIAVLRGAQPQSQDNDGNDKIPQFEHNPTERVGGDMSIHPR